MKMDECQRKYFADLSRKNGNHKAAIRYEEGLYNTMGVIDIEVLDDLIMEVRRLRKLEKVA